MERSAKTYMESSCTEAPEARSESVDARAHEVHHDIRVGDARKIHAVKNSCEDTSSCYATETT